MSGEASRAVKHLSKKKIMWLDIISSLFPEMLSVPDCGRAWGPEGFLRRASLACRATVLQVLRLLQVLDRPTLHGSAELPLLFCGVQEENHGLENQNNSLVFSMTTSEPRKCSVETKLRAEKTNTAISPNGYRCFVVMLALNKVPDICSIDFCRTRESAPSPKHLLSNLVYSFTYLVAFLALFEFKVDITVRS